MAEKFSNDNGVVTIAVRDPDAHGQAAMLLVESLLHGLIARKVISVAEAIAIVDVATEVRRDTGPERGDTPASLEKSVHLLNAVRESLSIDIR